MKTYYGLLTTGKVNGHQVSEDEYLTFSDPEKVLWTAQEPPEDTDTTEAVFDFNTVSWKLVDKAVVPTVESLEEQQQQLVTMLAQGIGSQANSSQELGALKTAIDSLMMMQATVLSQLSASQQKGN